MNSDVIVKGSSIEGKGVFANRDFKKGEIIIKWSIDTILTKEEVENLPENEKQYIFPLGDNFLLQQPPERYVNHSCDPNLTLSDYQHNLLIGIQPNSLQ